MNIHSVRELLEIVREGGIYVSEDLLRTGDISDKYYVSTGTQTHGPRKHHIGTTRRMPGKLLNTPVG